MKTKFSKLLMLLTTLMLFVSSTNSAQERMFLENNQNNDNVVMTWNKNTPEQEMLDDIKALKQNNGVTIKYSNLKRNVKGEITAIKVEYKDQDGNSGSQEYNGKNAIATIQFYKNGNQIGFGGGNNNGFAMNGFDFNDMQQPFMKQFNFDDNNAQSFEFSDEGKPNIKSKSKIIIKKDGKQPLVIEDGEVIEGGEGYSQEELDKIKSEQKFKLNDDGSKHLDFNFNSESLDMKKIMQQMEKLQSQMLQMNPDGRENSKTLKDLNNSKSDKDTTKEELKQAKEEMLKAKKEMEEAKKELQKAKSEIKMRKI
jgi:hypothetical protein